MASILGGSAVAYEVAEPDAHSFLPMLFLHSALASDGHTAQKRHSYVKGMVNSQDEQCQRRVLDQECYTTNVPHAFPSRSNPNPTFLAKIGGL